MKQFFSNLWKTINNCLLMLGFFLALSWPILMLMWYVWQQKP